MQHSTTISFNIATSADSVPLGLEIWVDYDCLLNIDHVQQPVTFKTNIADNEADHELRIILKNKLPEHTTVDDQGAIVQDAVLHVKDIQFDGIELGQIVADLAVYTHDFNGTGNKTQEKFYGTLGCNGTVSLKFSTPAYIWLLENM